jgi:F0F1-type ATP synthase membrane subunit b/b'
MADLPLTKKITAVIKGADKLIQDVLKDAKQIRDSATSLKDSFKKPPEDKPKD